jgi:hypothetical protein
MGLLLLIEGEGLHQGCHGARGFLLQSTQQYLQQVHLQQVHTWLMSIVRISALPVAWMPQEPQPTAESMVLL